MDGSSHPQRMQQAVILMGQDAGAMDPVIPLMRVGTLPIVLRSILTAKKTGVSRFLIVVNSRQGGEFRRALECHPQFPGGVQWITLNCHSSFVTEALSEIARLADEEFLLLPGGATFHARLLDGMTSLNGHGAQTLIVSQQPTGIYRLSRKVALAAVDESPSLSSWQEFDAWLQKGDSLDRKEGDEKYWQPIAGESDLPKAEAKLNLWLYKETDGLWSRLNRKISIPISRVLIRLGVTPNMVTMFTLAVSFISGVFFALGGYLNSVIGAVLSHWASILDGSDGEVARLTFQESDFGCWLETICDNFYYIFVFSGMIIGMYRTSGSLVYPIAGGLLAFGTIMSMIVTAYQRRRITRQQPEKYLVTWQKRMDTQTSNIFIRFARRHEFMIRRSFLPYAILFFSILNLLQVVLLLLVVGANLVWILALYSNRFFRHGHSAATADLTHQS